MAGSSLLISNNMLVVHLVRLPFAIFGKNVNFLPSSHCMLEGLLEFCQRRWSVRRRGSIMEPAADRSTCVLNAVTRPGTTKTGGHGRRKGTPAEETALADDRNGRGGSTIGGM